MITEGSCTGRRRFRRRRDRVPSIRQARRPRTTPGLQQLNGKTRVRFDRSRIKDSAA
jgi:hypothetical protein